MYKVQISLEKNAILAILEGRMEEAELRAGVAKYREGVDRLRPGLASILDLTKYVPVKEEHLDILASAMSYASAKGVSRAIRIVSPNASSGIGNMQLNRTARKEHMPYNVEIARSMEEAKKMLGW